MKYRDFVYLDIDKIQSILSQLDEGLVNSYNNSKTDEISFNLKARIKAALTMLFSGEIDLGVDYKNIENITKDKILHDYIFELAKDSLFRNQLIINATDIDRVGFKDVKTSSFLVIKGFPVFYDHMEFEKTVSKFSLFLSYFETGKLEKQKDSDFDEVIKFIKILFEELIKVEFINQVGLKFVGVLNRDFLRETMKNIIFNYGNKPQGEWNLLCQITKIPDDTNTSFMEKLDNINLPNVDSGEMKSINQIVDPILEGVNELEEIFSSVSYPDIIVTPIALYRETE